MSTFTKYICSYWQTTLNSTKPADNMFYYYINNTNGFYYYFNERGLRNVLIVDNCNSEEKFKKIDTVKRFEFDSLEEFFNDFQNVFKSFNPNGHLTIYNIMTILCNIKFFNMIH